MHDWTGKWIGYKYDPREDLGFFAFRHLLSLDSVPDSLGISVSADNRYKLFVNGEMVAFGPQRGDEKHWFYESLDLAPFLHEGENQIVALVWNFGWLAPMAQHTVRTAFLFDAPTIEGLSTPGDWSVRRVEGWDFEMMHSKIGDFYIDIGPGEVISPEGARFLEAAEGYGKPYVIYHAEERGNSTGGTPWMLVPRTLPPMKYMVRERRPTMRFSGNPSQIGMLKRQQVATLQGSLLLDYEELLCAYPRLTLSGPPGSVVMVTYAEAPRDEKGEKGNRNEVEGKEIFGYQDKLVLGPEPTVYEPVWWRTYRYLLIEVVGSERAAEAARTSTPLPPSSFSGEGAGSGQPFPRENEEGEVILHSIEAVETGYPLVAESSFVADDPWVEKIWDVSLRTAERCAGETYFDCPYYEQLQYVGDTRIQALIGYYLGRDRSLQRNAVETLGWSIMENGLTQSRYPSRQVQVIPPFSLWWVAMLKDQQLYDDSNDKWEEPGERVLETWIDAARGTNAFWNFCDWVPEWKAGVPASGSRSPEHYLTYALAVLLERTIEHGGAEDAASWFWKDAQKFIEALRPVEGLVKMDAMEHAPSEHIEALFRLCQQLLRLDVEPWPTIALAAANAAKCTYYFAYYKHLAMFGRPGNPFDYLQELQPWKEQIEMGLTTFAENPEPTRSDCHAWSAHPILGFFQIVAGVTSVAPGWKKAKIMPHPGSLKRFDAHIAHPDGDLNVRYENERLEVDSPIPFTLNWQGETGEFQPGRHKF